jgi:hypothetical protein
MTRPILRGLAVGLLGALASAAAIVVAYARAPELVLTMGTDPPTLVRGLYPIERDPDGITFAWTRERVTLTLPGLDRNHEWTLVARVKAGRADTRALPDLSVDVDGVTRRTVRIGNAWQEVAVPLPTSPGRARGARLSLQVSNTFVPGPGDPRPLGIVVDELRIDPPPSGIPIAPVPALFAATCAGALFGVAFGLVGLTADRAVMAVLALAVAQAAALTHGWGPYAAWVGQLPWLAFWIAGALVLLTTAVRLGMRRTPPHAASALPASGSRFAPGRLRNTALFVAVFSAAVLYLKLLVLLHPNMPIGDALFQAHRFEWVRAGRWFFTSVAPGGYEFPYAIGLYVFAMPFAPLVSGTLGLMAMLRIVVAAADAVAGILIYPAIVHRSGDRLAGALAVAAFHLVLLNFGVQATGNLTNAFGQSLFVAALAIVLAGFDGRGRLASSAGVVVAAAAAMLSHTSTFAILAVVLVLAAAACRALGGPPGRRRAAPVLAAVALATLVAIGLYYAHFGDTYASQYARISGELSAPAAQSDPGGRSVADRAALVPHNLGVYYGWPLLLLAVAGLGTLRQTDRTLSATIVAWLGGCALFLFVGILTPVDLRHYLAAFPAVAMLAGLGGARLWRSGLVGRVATSLALTLATWLAVRQWLSSLA